MKIKSYKKDIFFLLGIFLTSIILICFISYLGRYNTFVGDDFGYSTSLKIFDAFIVDTHGRFYIGYFLSQFFCFNLPILLGIHPYDFIGVPNGIIKGILTIFILLSISSFSIFFNRNKKIHLTFFIISTLYFFTSVILSTSPIFECNYNFYRYFLHLMFFAMLWKHIYKNTLIKYKKINYYKLSIASISGFIVGTSVEISFYASILLCTLFILYNIIIHFISQIKNKEYIKKLYLNIDKNFYIPMCFLIIGIILFTSQNGYKDVARDRGMENIQLSFDLIKDFWNYYFHICFKFEYLYWLIFIPILIFCIYTAYKKQEIKKFIFPVLYLFSILITLFSLVLCGKTNFDMSIPYFYYNHYFITHNNIYFLYKMLLLIPLFICLSYILRAKRKTLICISLTLLMIFISIKQNTLENLILKSYANKEKKECMYIIEKITRFFHRRNETIQIPTLHKNNYTLDYVYDINLYIKVHIGKIYKDKDIENKNYELSDNAINNYLTKRGTISKLELKNINFSNIFYE